MNRSMPMNVFIIESPFQLLNAIEAKHRLGLADNKLVIILGYGYSRSGFQKLIHDEDWSSVEYVEIRIGIFDFESRTLGKYFSRKYRNLAEIYRLYSNRATINEIAESIRAADTVILGNYLQDGSQYLRHFANSVRHNCLVLIDDGTDVIKVNNARNRGLPTESGLVEDVDTLSLWKSAKRNFRELLVKLDNSEADKVLFFTAYDIHVRPGDEIVKNEYSHLRQNIRDSVQAEEIFFLGQCLIEDQWIDKQLYFDNLSKIQQYFAGTDIVYIPHPRESADTVDHVKDRLKFKIRTLDGPIEYCLSLSSNRPRVLASFFCSALVNCSIIYKGLFGIKAFYIDPERMLVERDLVRCIYDYFRTRSHEGLDVIKLDAVVAGDQLVP
jgi:hypothetical protein